jgi:hypothetical protein
MATMVPLLLTIATSCCTYQKERKEKKRKENEKKIKWKEEIKKTRGLLPV